MVLSAKTETQPFLRIGKNILKYAVNLTFFKYKITLPLLSSVGELITLDAVQDDESRTGNLKMN